METTTKTLTTTTEQVAHDVVADVRRWRMLTEQKQTAEAELKQVTARLVQSVGVGKSVVVDGEKATITQQEQRDVAIDSLNAVVSRRLFGTLTKRTVNWTNWDALDNLGKLPAGAKALMTKSAKAAYVVSGGKP